MQLVSTPRIDFLRGLKAEISHNYGRGRVIIAVDGAAGSGTGEFADGLAATFREDGRECMSASIEGFHRPRRERYARGRDNAQGFYEDSYDYLALRRVLIDPFRMAGSIGFQTIAFDLQRDAPVVSSWVTGPADMVLIVDGAFLNRAELRGIWNYSIHLDVSSDIAYARLAETAGYASDPGADSNQRYVRGQEIYQAEASPLFTASAVVDNSDAEHPKRVFVDQGCACG